MDYHELEKTTVSRLREMAKEKDPELKGTGGMKKQELVDLLAGMLGLSAPHRVVSGVDKATLKAEIRRCKGMRDAAIQAGDRIKLKESRRQLHRLRRSLRRATTITTD
jgi:hypothetical protein